MTESISRNPGAGIPLELARRRTGTLLALRYALELSVPEDPTLRVRGRVRIEFTLRDTGDWPVLDFAPFDDDAAVARAIGSVRANGVACDWRVHAGHILIDADIAAAGAQTIEIEFDAGAAGLRRRPQLVYTLFVPAFAHTVFPCFDQPDLKAPLTLELDLPGHWDALANAPERSRRQQNGRLLVGFAATEPLPPYLFAFVAGQLERSSATTGGHEYHCLVAPAAAAAMQRHQAEILRLHAAAIDELERYTGIAYPFSQTGFVLIPDFDFGGMEHPGCVFYRQELLLPDADATEATLQRRAGLIAHETAHMWFGNLVTMRWFGEVWLKEVFANVMADRVLASEFPNTDHDAAFMLRHYPPVSEIDRSAGAQPISRPLDNLATAGEMYDALIYHKAPIAIAELEQAIGAAAMQKGLRSYLAEHRFGNAAWDDLRARLQRETQHDLSAFSHRWLESAGRAQLGTAFTSAAIPRYGTTLTDAAACEQALQQLTATTALSRRSALWLLLFEHMLDGSIEPAVLLTAAIGLVERETNSLLIDRLLTDAYEIYWRCLDAGRRAFAAGPVERVLRLRLHAGTAQGFWLSALARFAVTEAALAEIESIWRSRALPAGNLNENLSAQLALILALHRPSQSQSLLVEQIERTRSPDRRARLQFIAPALAADAAVRDKLFDELLSGNEPGQWRISAVRLLNHPLRAGESLHYLEPGIAHAQALARRGDIFLPRQWLTALFHGHAGGDAAAIIRRCIDTGPLPDRLQQLLLQTADPVFRSERWVCR